MRGEKDGKLRLLHTLAALTALLLLAVMICLAVLLAPERCAQEPQEETSAVDAEEPETLAEREDFLPENLLYGESLPADTFKDDAGNVRSLSEYRGKTLILLIWGSWCEDCSRILESAAAYQEALAAYPQVQFLLIDRLDESRNETTDRARVYLEEHGVTFECWYDEGQAAYEAYGGKWIPTLLALDADGLLRYMTIDPPATADEMRAVLEYATGGGDSATYAFVRDHMGGRGGGIYTNYMENRSAPPSGTDVLSESQGLLMEYAVLALDKELFDRLYAYLANYMYLDGSYAWYVTADGEKAASNALLDDLRIFRALYMADGLWGGYGQELSGLAAAIVRHNFSGGGFVSFFDFNMGKAGDEIELCYADFTALEALSEYAQLPETAIPALEKIVENGYLGDDFPLYASSYSYGDGRYSTDELNTAEALMTLYHLAQRGTVRQASIDWLTGQIEKNTLAARYYTNGEPVPGYMYDSTAVYGLAALIGLEAGDSRLYTKALSRMEKARIFDAGSVLDGSFTANGDGSDIAAFDQLIPLLVYGKG